MRSNQKDIKKVDHNAKMADLANKDSHIQIDSISYFVLKKSEKLTAALYLVSSFIHVEEPVRVRLRLLSIEILSFITQQTISGGDANEEGKLCALVEEFCSLLYVATLSGYISTMNSNLLIKEYRDLLSLFVNEGGQRTGSRRAQKLPPNLFTVDLDSKNNKIRNIVTGGNVMLGGYNKGHFKGQSFGTDRIIHKQTISNASDSGHSTTIRQSLKKDRRSLIISKIRQKGSVSMKDLSDMTENCSEKTLQRELLSLVNEGVLKKEGERRWSTYMLA